MIKAVSELFFLLDDGQRKQFLLLQLLVIFMTLMEIVGITSKADPLLYRESHTLMGFMDYFFNMGIDR